ncbi:MAG TPA: type II toxin-antitoxin system RelE/ParE family toxin [Polyangiaceae bacterium]|nr:type II toxin-antitoxin system RelE/ParE family toxin [Polyangiaceae bacterium]
MSWEVEYTDEFAAWWLDLAEQVQDAIDRTIHLLEARGPTLPFPHSSDVRGSKHGHMRELRVQVGGDPYRIFYAFDPRRAAILLVGGNKVGDGQFYERMVPIADRVYDDHLQELEREKHNDKET